MHATEHTRTTRYEVKLVMATRSQAACTRSRRQQHNSLQGGEREGEGEGEGEGGGGGGGGGGAYRRSVRSARRCSSSSGGSVVVCCKPPPPVDDEDDSSSAS
eukprot:COSAG06_NODE_538_length_14479_cov_3.477608_6_plen_102_part_00